jgi:hypothetical protein
MAENNPHVFDEHHARVVAHNAAAAHSAPNQGHPDHSDASSTQAHSDYAQLEHSSPTEVHPDYAQLAQEVEADHALVATDHAEVVADHASVEGLRDELHSEVREQAWAHDQLVQREHRDFEAEEVQIAHLEAAVHQLAEQEHADHAELESEKHELAVEKNELHHQEEEIQEEKHRLERLEKEYRDQSHGEHHESTEHHEAAEHHEVDHHEEEQEEHHSATAHEPVTVGSEEPVHFFTPVTLILSVLFIGVLAVVFRVYLFPYFVKRYAKQTPSHYYSHAY